MFVLRTRVNTTLGVAALAAVALSLTPAVEAGLPPNVELAIEVDDIIGTNTTLNPVGTPQPDGMSFNYTGFFPGIGWNLAWNFNAVPDPQDFARIGTGFDITNQSGGPLEFHIRVTMPLAAEASGDANYLGSLALSMTGVDGFLQAPAGQSIWEAMADGVLVDSLFPNPGFLDFTGAGSAATNAALIPGNIGGPVTDDIGFQLNFSLSDGESLTLTGLFGVAPGPSALAFLGVGALLGRRRRRTA